MRFGKLIGAVLVGTLLMSGCSAGNGKVAMQIGDAQINEGAVKFMAQYAMGSTDVEAAAEQLKESYLIKEIAEKMDITLDETESKQIKSGIATFKSNAGGKKAGDKILKDLGIDDSVLEVILSSSVYAQQVMENITIEDATDEELRQYFKDSYLRAKHVLVSTSDMNTGEDFDEAKLAEAEQKANEVLEKAKNGDDFDALITEYNEDPGMASNPDGYFFTDGEMVSEFEDATKSIQPNEITMCKSDFGYHIIKRLPLDESDSNFEKFFNDNKTAIQSAIQSKKQQDAIAAKAEELGITVDVKQDVVDSIVLEPAATPEGE